MKEFIVHESKSAGESEPMLLIGQDMHIMNPDLLDAVAQRDAEKLAGMAQKQATAGAHALDLNLGPARKSCQAMHWAVETIQGAVNIPLFISSRILDQPEILALHRGTATVNSVTADPASLAENMGRAGQYNAHLVVLLVRPGLTSFAVDERLALAVEVLDTAASTGFPIENLYLDPLFHLRPDPMTWQLSKGMPDIDSVLETLKLLPQLTGERVRTLVALSSASQFLPPAERFGLHQRLLPMLASAGCDAVILNCHDRRLMEIGLHPELKDGGDSLCHPRLQTDRATSLPW